MIFADEFPVHDIRTVEKCNIWIILVYKKNGAKETKKYRAGISANPKTKLIDICYDYIGLQQGCITILLCEESTEHKSKNGQTKLVC